MESGDRLSGKTKLLYGVGDVGNAIVNSSVQFFLLIFYTDAALIGPALAANALLVGKLWDAVNDPLFGWLSDRTSSRFGKRRVFMIFGALPLAVSVMLLWFVPGGLSDTGLFVWVALTFVLFDTLWTLTNVPYYALTAELTDDYDERASLTTFRMVLGVPAYIVGAALTPVIVGLFAAQRAGYGVVGVLYGIIAAGVLWIAAAGLRERKEISQARAESSPLRSEATMTFLDGILSTATALGLLLNAAAGWWWADPSAALIVAVFAANEARENWEEAGEIGETDSLG